MNYSCVQNSRKWYRLTWPGLSPGYLLISHLLIVYWLNILNLWCDTNNKDKSLNWGKISYTGGFQKLANTSIICIFLGQHARMTWLPSSLLKETTRQGNLHHVGLVNYKGISRNKKKGIHCPSCWIPRSIVSSYINSNRRSSLWACFSEIVWNRSVGGHTRRGNLSYGHLKHHGKSRIICSIFGTTWVWGHPTSRRVVEAWWWSMEQVKLQMTDAPLVNVLWSLRNVLRYFWWLEVPWSFEGNDWRHMWGRPELPLQTVIGSRSLRDAKLSKSQITRRGITTVYRWDSIRHEWVKVRRGGYWCWKHRKQRWCNGKVRVRGCHWCPWDMLPSSLRLGKMLGILYEFLIPSELFLPSFFLSSLSSIDQCPHPPPTSFSPSQSPPPLSLPKGCPFPLTQEHSYCSREAKNVKMTVQCQIRIEYRTGEVLAAEVAVEYCK